MKRLTLLALGLLLLIPTSARAGESDRAKVAEIDGQATYKKAGTSDWKPLTKDTVLYENDSLKTDELSTVKLVFEGAHKTADVSVRPATQFTLHTFSHESEVDTTLLDMELGSVLIEAQKLKGASKFEVKTPTSIVGIRGTVFEVNVSD